MRRLALLIFALTPGLAAAAPLVAVLGAEVIVGLGITWGTVIFTAATIIYGQAQQRKQKKEAARQAQAGRESFNANLRDRTISGVATEFNYRTIYGRARVGGNVVAIFKSGARDEYKHIIVQLAPHECDAIEDVYIAALKVGPLDSNGVPTSGNFSGTEAVNEAQEFIAGAVKILTYEPINGTISVIGHKLSTNDERPNLFFTNTPIPFFMVSTQVIAEDAGYSTVTVNYQWLKNLSPVRITKHLGGMTDPADAQTVADTGGVWNNNCVLRGHTYLAIRLNLNQPEFQNGLPSIEAVIRGKKLYDPRSGATTWSQNNSLVTYDYLTSEMGGVTAGDLPLAAYIAAANDCDDFVVTGGWSGPRYQFDGVITSDQGREDVLEKMAQSMAGGIDATTWTIFAGKYSAPIMALQQADVIGEIGISPGQAQGDVYNTVRGQYIGADRDYVVNDYAAYSNAGFIANDGEVLATNIDFPYTSNQQRVTNLARIYTEQNRNAFSVNGRFSLKTWRLNVGERVTLTMPLFGFAAKVFRVTDKKFTREQFMQLGLKEDAPEIYDLADQTVADATPNTNLPSPFLLAALTGLFCESGTDALMIQEDGSIVSRILVTWPPAVTADIIEIEYQLLGAADWQKASAPGDAVSAYISPVNDSSFIQVRARAARLYFNVKSAWRYAALHRVIGKSEPPPSVTALSIAGLLLSWPAVFALDMAGYLLRFHYGASFDWGSATPLHTGVLTAGPHPLAARPSGVVTIMIKAVDTSGNESAQAAVVITDLGDAPLANVVETFNFRAQAAPVSTAPTRLAPGRYSYVLPELQSFARAGTATYIDVAGVIRTAAVNAARFDFSPVSHAARGLLVENANTNFLPWSSAFDNLQWTRGAFAGVNQNAIAAPDQTLSADKLFVQPIVNKDVALLSYQSAQAFAIGEDICISLFTKQADSNNLTIMFNGAAFSVSGVGSQLNLATGERYDFGTSLEIVTAAAIYAEQYLDGWMRYAISRKATAAGTVNIDLEVSGGAGTVAERYNKGVYLWGAQISRGRAPESYIPTAGAVVTRADDIAIIPGVPGTPGAFTVNGYIDGGYFENGLVLASALNSFYGNADQSFYGASGLDPFYALQNYSAMRYLSAPITVSRVLAGSLMTLDVDAIGVDLTMAYRLAGPQSFYAKDVAHSFYGPGPDSFYGAPGKFIPWPGQITAMADIYQFSIAMGGGAIQARINTMALIVDAPDLVEYVENVSIAAGGVAIPYLKSFAAIKAITATLQANLSGAETVEIDKTINLTPRAKAFNAAHQSVGGASADLIIKGY